MLKLKLEINSQIVLAPQQEGIHQDWHIGQVHRSEIVRRTIRHPRQVPYFK